MGGVGGPERGQMPLEYYFYLRIAFFGYWVKQVHIKSRKVF